MRRFSLAMVLLTVPLTLPVAADEYTAPMQAYMDENLSSWINHADLVAAIKAQNERTAGLSNDDVVALDNQWRAEVGTGATPTIDSVLTAPVSAFLRTQMDAAEGAITEVFVMDAQGLNVGATDTTSDYWQGDEAKHQETYGTGAAAVHISDVEFDDSTQSYQGQISATIIDPETGAAIGAITVGVNAEALM